MCCLLCIWSLDQTLCNNYKWRYIKGKTVATITVKTKTDLRIVKTEKAITEAFMRLLSQMEYSQITVSALSREANINRKTFYAHYATVDDLLERVYTTRLQEILEPVQEQMEKADAKAIVKVFVFTVLQALEDNFENESNIVRNLGFFKLSDIVLGPLETYLSKTRKMHQLPEVTAATHRYLVCCVASILAAYIDWHHNGKKDETLEQLSQRVYEFISHGLSLA